MESLFLDPRRGPTALHRRALAHMTCWLLVGNERVEETGNHIMIGDLCGGCYTTGIHSSIPHEQPIR